MIGQIGLCPKKGVCERLKVPDTFFWAKPPNRATNNMDLDWAGLRGIKCRS